MSTLDRGEFFKQQEELMNLSDDDTDEHYVARMTGNNNQSNQFEDIVMIDLTHFDDVQDASTPATRGFKRKTSEPFRSPRIKRSKITTQLDARGAIFERKSDNHIAVNVSIDVVTPLSRGTLHKEQSMTPESVGAQKSAETIIIDDDHTESKLPPPSKSTSIISSNPSSPIDNASFSSVVISPRETAKKKLSTDIHVESKHTASRKINKKPIPLAQRLPPKLKPRANPADETSLIGDFSTSALSSSSARDGRCPVIIPQIKDAISTGTAPRPLKNPYTKAKAPESSTAAAPNAAKKPSTAARAKVHADISSIVAAKAATKLPTAKAPAGFLYTEASRPAKKPSAVTKGITTAKGKGKEASPEKISVFAYTVKAQAEADAAGAGGTKKYLQFLEGCTILHIGLDFNSKFMGDSTKKRITKFIECGGRIIPAYDPSKVTHIVTDADISIPVFLRGVGVDNLAQIPDHIPIIHWGWMVHMLDSNPFRKRREIKQLELFSYAVFPSRIPPTSTASKVSVRKHAPRLASSVDFSHISEFSIQPDQYSKSDALISPNFPAPQQRGGKVVNTASSSRVPLQFRPQTAVKKEEVADPLVEFYEGGSHLNEYISETDISDVEEDDDQAVQMKKKREWLCKKPDMNTEPSPNQDIIEKLEDLQVILKSSPLEEDRWKVMQYGKSIRALRQCTKRIKTAKQARNLNGVGEKTADKIMEIIETGDLQRLYYAKTEVTRVTGIFTKIYGVGQQTAMKWYHNGCRTLDDLVDGKGGVKLTYGQQIGIQFYEDLNVRMPRREAKAIFELIKPIALSIDSKLYVEIMGSYRRKKSDCGDIDILITRCPDDGRTHEGALTLLLDKLHTAGILTEDLAVPNSNKSEENPLEACYHGICRLPGVEGALRRRIDILTVPWHCKGGALLYYTGDDHFNRSMRLLANKSGFSLNQRGLYQGVIRDRNDRSKKTNPGTLIPSDTEEKIFKILGVPWREPEERVTHYQDLVMRTKG